MTGDRDVVVWGLIGTGDIARKRVGSALTTSAGSRLQAVAAAHPERAQAFARDFGVPAWYYDWRALVRDPQVTAIYVASPVVFHRGQVLAAARAGKHVLCEKPLAMNAREGLSMVKACRRAGVLFGTAYYRRFYPVIVRIKEILSSGETGRPHIVQMNAFSHFDPAPDHPRRWLIDRKISGGGPLKDFGCHRIELLLHLLGEYRSSVSLNENLRWSRGVEDTAVLCLRFKDNCIAQLTVSHAVLEAADSLEIYCAAGSLHVPSLNGERLVVRTRSGEREEKCAAPGNRHAPLIEDFVGAIHGRRPCAVSGEMGMAVDRIIDRVYR
jgi:predicted dehydrogenase